MLDCSGEYPEFCTFTRISIPPNQPSFSMFKYILVAAALLTLSTSAFAQKREIKVVTTIESVVPGGLGRSRMISSDSLGTLEEVKMDNFFSLVGINFGNIKDNDKSIASKISGLTNAGWKLEFVNSGAYSSEGSNGLFITRYLFSREKK